MSNRLDQEREKELEPKRVQYAIDKLKEKGYDPEVFGGKRIQFEFKGNTITHWPYSGWHSGKGIKDGRGIHKLLEQI